MIEQDLPSAPDLAACTEPRDLMRAFQAFSEVANRLNAAYDGLRQSAAKLDRELADANRRLEEKVAQLENLSGSLAAVLRAIPSGVVVAATDGTLLMVNPAAERLLERSVHELVGRPASSIVDRAGNPLLRLPDGPSPIAERVMTPGAEARIVDGAVLTVDDAAGNALGLVEVMNDRSEVKALQEEVRRLDRLAELGRMAAIIAHEIRNPLSGIRGFAGMLHRQLQKSENAETERRWTRRICEGVERADAIIDSVLFLARPRPMKTGEVDAEQLLAESLERVLAAKEGAARGVRARRKVEPAGLTVRADATRVEQALVNLIQNSIEAMNGEGQLELSARREGDVVALYVRDSGPGVSAALRATVFEPFFSTKSDGAGLGLALVARIAELHGGTVSLVPGIGTGAGFRLALPAGIPPKETSVQ